MSLIFEALQTLESARDEIDAPPPSEALEYIRCAERRLASEWETALWAPNDEGNQPPAIHELRQRAVEPPLPVATEAQRVLPAPAAINQNAPPTAPTPARSAEKSPIKLSSGVQRVVNALRSALPFVQRILPLLDGNNGTADSALVTRRGDAHPAPQLPPPVDLEPIEHSLTELKTQQRALRDKVVEQKASLKRVEDHLEMVREATDRNTLEQQELIGELKGVGKKVNLLAIVGLGLLAVTLVFNIVLCLHVLKVIH
jgi:hypothetical protein